LLFHYIPLFFFLLIRYRFYQFDNTLAVGHTYRCEQDLPLSTKNDCGRYAADSITLSHRAANAIQYIQTHHRCLVLHIPFDPIHDGFGQEAGASGVAIELDDDGLIGLDQGVKLVE